MGEYVITNPASVDAKESTARAVAGAAAGVMAVLLIVDEVCVRLPIKGSDECKQT